MFRWMLLLLISTCAFADSSFDEWNEDLILPEEIFDEWNVEQHVSNEDFEIFVFTKEDESIDQWTELLTVQCSYTTAYSPLFAAMNFIEMLKMNGLSINSEILAVDEDSVLFEWSLEHPAEFAQRELVLYFQGYYGSYFVRYTNKNRNILDQWKERFDQIYLDYQPLSYQTRRLRTLL